MRGRNNDSHIGLVIAINAYGGGFSGCYRLLQMRG